MKDLPRKHNSPTILIIGANGQLGTELVGALAERHGHASIIATDLGTAGSTPGIHYESLDALDGAAIKALAETHRVTQIYLLAAALSARGEQHPQWAWDLNTRSLLIVLELAREMHLERVFWPSSIAAFGPSTPKLAAQTSIMDPTTVYGLSKLVGERWCAWYHLNHGVDVRSLRYPGLISYKARAGGGTTDYAIHMLEAAARVGTYTCFLAEHQALPLMYMEDALRATLQLMEAPAEAISQRGSYNIAGFSATPAQLAASIRRQIPSFSVTYAPDFRQIIAASWPAEILDQSAQADWNWAPTVDLDRLVDDMLAHLPAPASSLAAP